MLKIRKIERQDTKGIKTFIRGIMQREFREESYAFAMHDLSDPVQYYGGAKDIFLVAKKDGRIIGTVAIKEDSPDTALLRRVFVRKSFRGKGYGEMLVAKAVDFCFKHDYQTLVFRGTDRMQQALKLCLKQGFKEDDIITTDKFKIFVLTKKLQGNKPVES